MCIITGLENAITPQILLRLLAWSAMAGSVKTSSGIAINLFTCLYCAQLVVYARFFFMYVRLRVIAQTVAANPPKEAATDKRTLAAVKGSLVWGSAGAGFAL